MTIKTALALYMLICIYLTASAEITSDYIGNDDVVFVARANNITNLVLEAEIKVPSSSVTKCFDTVLRYQTDGSSIVLCYNDGSHGFAVKNYDKGNLITNYDSMMAITREYEDRIINFQKDNWYILYASLWPEEEPQPPWWQFENNVILNEAGRVGIISPSETELELRSVMIRKNIEKVLKDQRIKLHQQAENKLWLEVIAVPFTNKNNGTESRRIDVVTLADDERWPISGTILVEADDFKRNYILGLEDAFYGVYTIYSPGPEKSKSCRVTFATIAGKKLHDLVVLEPAGDLTWKDYVEKNLETFIQKGTDLYGLIHPLFKDIVDVYTLNAPEKPLMLDDRIRTEDLPDHGRQCEGGSNLWLDQPTLKTMYLYSEISGEPKYAQGAYAYIEYVLQNCVKTNGMKYWGSHSYWNGFTESSVGDGIHETLIKHADWENMHRINPKAVKKEIDGFWEYHEQYKETGRNNRHDSPGGGDLAFSSGSFILGFCFTYSVTGEQHYLDKARLLTEWHYSHRSRETGLIPDVATTGERADKGGKLDWSGEHMFTSISGCYTAQLLRSFELSNDPVFRDRAIECIKAYKKYAWNEQMRNYYSMLRFRDGKPVVEYDTSRAVPERPFSPFGYVNFWRTIMYTFEFPLVAAQASVYAYELSDIGNGRHDPELLNIAKHWAEVIEKSLPPKQGRRFEFLMEIAIPELKKTGGTYAENYGRAISFFVHLYRTTNDKHYLNLVDLLAKETLEKLYVNGLFKGHPAKPYYQANDGVGYLLWALMELNEPSQAISGAF